MVAAPRPIRIGISACLLGAEVRYDGGHKRDAWLAGTLARRVTFVPVCPEVEIGLGTPRPPVRLERRGRGVRLVEPGSGTDLTRRMASWAKRRLDALEALGLSGFVLKAKSPSCGKSRVEVWGPRGRPARAGRGVFAEALLRRWPDLPVEDEERLRDPGVRADFFRRAVRYRGEITALGPRREVPVVNRWLVKSDPEAYSFDDLVRDARARWDGVTNPLALKHLRAMRKGDEVLVYATGDEKAIVGTAKVASDPYPDPQAKDPRVVAVDLVPCRRLPRPVPLAAVKADPSFAEFPLVRMGRLSVMPVGEAEWKRLLAKTGE